MSLAEIATQVDNSRRSQGRRRAPGIHARTRALAASVGALKRSEHVVAYVSPATHAELIRCAELLGVFPRGLAAYLIETGLRDLCSQETRGAT